MDLAPKIVIVTVAAVVGFLLLGGKKAKAGEGGKAAYDAGFAAGVVDAKGGTPEDLNPAENKAAKASGDAAAWAKGYGDGFASVKKGAPAPAPDGKKGYTPPAPKKDDPSAFASRFAVPANLGGKKAPAYPPADVARYIKQSNEAIAEGKLDGGNDGRNDGRAGASKPADPRPNWRPPAEYTYEDARQGYANAYVVAFRKAYWGERGVAVAGVSVGEARSALTAGAFSAERASVGCAALAAIARKSGPTIGVGVG